MSGQELAGSQLSEQLPDENCSSCFLAGVNCSLSEITHCFCTLDASTVPNGSSTTSRRKLTQSCSSDSFGSDMLFQLTAKQLLFNRKPTLIDNLIFRNKSAILRNQMDSGRGRKGKRSSVAGSHGSRVNSKRHTSDIDSENNDMNDGSDGSSLTKGGSGSIPAVKRLRLSAREDSSDRSTCSTASRNGSTERNDAPSKRKKMNKGQKRISDRLQNSLSSLRSGKKRTQIKENCLLKVRRNVMKKTNNNEIKKKTLTEKLNKDLMPKESKQNQERATVKSGVKKKMLRPQGLKPTGGKQKKKLPQASIKTSSSKTDNISQTSQQEPVPIKKMRKKRRKVDSMIWLKKPIKVKSSSIIADTKETDISCKSENSMNHYEPDDSGLGSEVKLEVSTTVKTEIDNGTEIDLKPLKENDFISPCNIESNSIDKTDGASVILKKEGKPVWNIEPFIQFESHQCDSVQNDFEIADSTSSQFSEENKTEMNGTESSESPERTEVSSKVDVMDEMTQNTLEDRTEDFSGIQIESDNLSEYQLESSQNTPLKQDVEQQDVTDESQKEACLLECQTSFDKVEESSLTDTTVEDPPYTDIVQEDEIQIGKPQIESSLSSQDSEMQTERQITCEITTSSDSCGNEAHNKTEHLETEKVQTSEEVNYNVSKEEEEPKTFFESTEAPKSEINGIESAETLKAEQTSKDVTPQDNGITAYIGHDLNKQVCESYKSSESEKQSDENSYAKEEEVYNVIDELKEESKVNGNHTCDTVNPEVNILNEETKLDTVKTVFEITSVRTDELVLSRGVEELSECVKENGAVVRGDEPVEREALKNDLLKALGLQSLRTLSTPPSPEKPKPLQATGGYTGTLKAVIKLNRGSDKKSRSMVFKAPEDKPDKLEYQICTEVGNTATGVPITHLADISGVKKTKEKVLTDFDTVSNSPYVGTGVPHIGGGTTAGSEASDSGDEKQGSKESSLVIPEKSSSFSIHPERLCSDVCCYCFGKFGSLDTPCHVAQIKGEERQQKILKNEPYLTVESCLCDACYRYVDRKANCPNQSKPKRSKPPMSTICCVTDCTEQATHTVKRKWLLKIKRSITHKFDIDMEKHNSVYNPLCSNHHYWVDYYMVCGICRKRLNRNHLFTLGSETDKLNLMLAEDGIPARLSDKLFLCKLCRYYTNMRLKYSDPASIPTSSQPFYKNYRKKILASLDVPVSDSEEELLEKKKKKESGKGKGDDDMDDVMSLSGLATLLGDQPEQQPRIQVKFGNVNIGTLSNLNIGQGRQEERTQYNRGGDSPLPLSANFDFQGPSTSDGSWEKVTSTLQFDKKTKQLWQDLQRPYGNQSSFLRHLVMLEKFWRAGYLMLSDTADVRAAKYINSVQTRIKSFEGKTESKETILKVPNVSVPRSRPPVFEDQSQESQSVQSKENAVSTSLVQTSVAATTTTSLTVTTSTSATKELPSPQFCPIIATGEIEVTPVNPLKANVPKEKPQSKGTLIIQKPIGPGLINSDPKNPCKIMITNVGTLAKPKTDKSLLDKAKCLVRMVSPGPSGLRQRSPTPIPIARLPRSNSVGSLRVPERYRVPQPYHHSTQLYQHHHIPAPLQYQSLQAQLQSPPQHYHNPLQSLQQVVYQPRGFTGPPPLVKITTPPPSTTITPHPPRMTTPPPPYPKPQQPQLRPILPKLPQSLSITPQSTSLSILPSSITLPSSGITIEKQSDNFHAPPVLPPEKPIISVFREPLPAAAEPNT